MKDLEEVLQKGEENAMPANELMSILGLNNTRELRRCIAAARKQGMVICASSTGGYFVPATKGEISKWIRTVSRKAESTFAMLKSARVELQDINGQISINDLEK